MKNAEKGINTVLDSNQYFHTNDQYFLADFTLFLLLLLLLIMHLSDRKKSSR